jgi:hypothetical protein
LIEKILDRIRRFPKGTFFEVGPLGPLDFVELLKRLPFGSRFAELSKRLPQGSRCADRTDLHVFLHRLRRALRNRNPLSEKTMGSGCGAIGFLPFFRKGKNVSNPVNPV